MIFTMMEAAKDLQIPPAWQELLSCDLLSSPDISRILQQTRENQGVITFSTSVGTIFCFFFETEIVNIGYVRFIYRSRHLLVIYREVPTFISP
jgi:hypothetical protein